ncbi:hypothetical protein AVEN_115112-1 [Araneus ventricosus]|uniref:Uncharacterized protein n=1 Tax=Araneus ventricosus TaxID=182803 RepID=A0A4Y1ZXA6_ARAVE|nr:hypothetical protein AVEN_115112-1 [Araneus ventricosus]
MSMVIFEWAIDKKCLLSAKRIGLDLHQYNSRPHVSMVLPTAEVVEALLWSNFLTLSSHFKTSSAIHKLAWLRNLVSNPHARRRLKNPLNFKCRGDSVVRSRPWDRRVPGSKPDSTEDPPCTGPAAR